MIVCNENSLAGSAANCLQTRRQRTAEKRANQSASEDEEDADMGSQPRGMGAPNHLKSLSLRQQPRKRILNDPILDGK